MQRPTERHLQVPAGAPRATRSTVRLLATSVLALESLVVLFATLTIFGLRTSALPPAAVLGIGLGVSLLFVLGCAAVRAPWGIACGWGLQALLLLLGIFEISMVVIGAAFAATWWYAVRLGRRIDRERESYEGAPATPQTSQ